MSELYQSLSHSKRDCKYPVVFVPKRRRKAIFGQTRRPLGQIFNGLARQKECQILEEHLMPDHVHMCIAIPPKHPVASVIGFLKGKSAIAIARLCGKERNFTGEHFWARGLPCPRSGSNWSRSANTSASRRSRLDCSEPLNKARFSATPRHLADRLWGGPTHQATRSAGGV